MDQTNKLFVGNLDYSVTTDELKEFFSQFGTVTDAIVLFDRQTNRSKGFGFVTMSTAAEAEAAKAGAMEIEFKGRKLNVSTARPPKPRDDRGGFGGGSRGGFGGRRDFNNRGGRDY